MRAIEKLRAGCGSRQDESGPEIRPKPSSQAADEVEHRLTIIRAGRKALIQQRLAIAKMGHSRLADGVIRFDNDVFALVLSGRGSGRSFC